jgi:hypothetical protein
MGIFLMLDSNIANLSLQDFRETLALEDLHWILAQKANIVTGASHNAKLVKMASFALQVVKLVLIMDVQKEAIA